MMPGRHQRIAAMLLVAVIVGAAVGLKFAGGDGASSKRDAHKNWFKPDSTELASCNADLVKGQRCRMQALGNIAYKVDAAAAFKVLQPPADIGGVYPCHQVAHAIGRSVLTRKKGNVAQALAEGSSGIGTTIDPKDSLRFRCVSGYYHGIFEMGLQQAGNEKVESHFRNACNMEPPLRFQCLHGLGHAAVLFRAYELDRGLSLCDELVDRDQRTCYVGALHENANGNFREGESKWAKVSDPSWPCRVLDEKYRADCYFAVGRRLVQDYDGSLVKAGQACLGFRPAEQVPCYHAIGAHAGFGARTDIGIPMKVCGVQRMDLRRGCIAGAVETLALVDKKDNLAGQVCATVPPADRPACAAAAATRANVT